jgi:hypothetical protein
VKRGARYLLTSSETEIFAYISDLKLRDGYKLPEDGKR